MERKRETRAEKDYWLFQRPKGTLRDTLGQPGLCLLMNSIVSGCPLCTEAGPLGALWHVLSLSEVQCIVGLLLGMPIPWPGSDPL